MKKASVIGTILILVLSTFVLAAGSSTNNRRNSTSNSSNSNNEVSCENILSLRERIKCRLENKGVAIREANGSVEEACRGLSSQTACQRLYEKSARCYSQDDSAVKKRCFLSEAGININAGGTFRVAPKEAKRNYVVLLLYELQERLEKMQETGRITSDQASSLITKIVEIKRMILSVEPRENIVIKINEFKREYKSVVLGIGGRGNVGNYTNTTTYNVTNST